MAVRNDFAAGEVLAAADLNDTFASKADYPSGGSNGDLLTKSGTTTAWASPSVAGLTLITAETFTAVSAVNINNCFTSTYENYRIVYRATGSISNRTILRLRASGTDAATNYAGRVFSSTPGGDSGGSGATTAVFPLDASSTVVTFVALDVFQPAEASPTGFLSFGSTNAPDLRICGARHTASTSFDGFSLIADSSGNISGTVYVYGYRKA